MLQRLTRRGRTLNKLNGKSAVVTGASKGFGSAIAKALAAEGASVVVNFATDDIGAARTVDEIKRSGGTAVAVKASVTSSADVTNLFAETARVFGGLDILVNNAGVYTFGPLADFTEENYRLLFDTNVLGTLLVTHEGVKHFGAKGGSVINIGTAGTTLNLVGSVTYTATKGAIDSITRVLANELGPQNIRVNAVSPGIVLTEGVSSAGMTVETPFVADLIKRTPLGRAGTPQDIADVVTFLATDDARWVTGQLIQASGGLR